MISYFSLFSMRAERWVFAKRKIRITLVQVIKEFVDMLRSPLHDVPRLYGEGLPGNGELRKAARDEVGDAILILGRQGTSYKDIINEKVLAPDNFLGGLPDSNGEAINRGLHSTETLMPVKGLFPLYGNQTFRIDRALSLGLGDGGVNMNDERPHPAGLIGDDFRIDSAYQTLRKCQSYL